MGECKYTEAYVQVRAAHCAICASDTGGDGNGSVYCDACIDGHPLETSCCFVNCPLCSTRACPFNSCYHYWFTAETSTQNACPACEEVFTKARSGRLTKGAVPE